MHAIPELSEYSGMPLSKEVGPVTLCPDFEFEAVSMIRENTASFTVWDVDECETIEFKKGKLQYKNAPIMSIELTPWSGRL